MSHFAEERLRLVGDVEGGKRVRSRVPRRALEVGRTEQHPLLLQELLPLAYERRMADVIGRFDVIAQGGLNLRDRLRNRWRAKSHDFPPAEVSSPRTTSCSGGN